jgi:hypothetical protein
MTAPVCEEQVVRTERARALVLNGDISLSPAGPPGAWLAVNGDGRQYTVTEDSCTCPDYTVRCQPNGWRCKHMEALRLIRKEVSMSDTLQGIIEKLEAPFPSASVRWKPQKIFKGKGRALAVAYIDARDVLDRLDSVLGSFNWQSAQESAGSGVITRIGIRNPETGEWIWKSDVGFVGGDDTDEERTKAAKGSASDGIKRASVQWGIGRYFYRLEPFFVDYDESARKMLETPVLPDWALPVEERKKKPSPKAKPAPPAPATSTPPANSPKDRVYGKGGKVNGNFSEQQAFDRFLATTGKVPYSVEKLREWVAANPAAAKSASN